MLKRIVSEARALEADFEEERRQLGGKDEEELKAAPGRKIPPNASLQAADQPNKGGKFVRVEGENFDVILNILIGIRRSLNNLTELPG